MRHIFIINPAAGSAKGDTELRPELQTFLRGSGLDYEIHRTLNKEETGSYVRQRAAEGGEVRFYACGGDGTVCDVVNGMAGFENAQLAVYPCGTGNDFVRSFTNSSNFQDIRRLIEAEPVYCDLIKWNEHYALNMLNIGVDCDVAARASEIKGKPFSGSAAYLAAAAQILPHFSTYRISYEADGQKHEEELMLAAVANGHFCGGGFLSSPRSCLSDGMLNISIVRPVRGLRMLRMLAQYRQGKHLDHEDNLRYIQYFRCRELSIEPIDPVRVCIDGEILPLEPMKISCLPCGIRLALPAGCREIG